MIQAEDGLRYAYRRLSADFAGARVARAQQSAAAESLLQELRAVGQRPGASSKAHSRTLVAAAVAPNGPVGIDVEYHAPGRRIREVARWLMGADVGDEGAAYRVFTFYEAYFKAMGVFPSAETMRSVAGAENDLCVLEGLNVLACVVERDFTLTLVWGGSGAAMRD